MSINSLVCPIRGNTDIHSIGYLNGTYAVLKDMKSITERRWIKWAKRKEDTK